MGIDCAICKDYFDGNVSAISTKCGHVFHGNCIERWLQQNSTCPECRRKLQKGNITKLFFNYSFENTSDNSDLSIDTLKDHLLEKNQEIAEKNKKIAIVEREKLNLENEISYLQRKVQDLNDVEERNKNLIAKNNSLQNELEDLINNVETIANKCCFDARRILYYSRDEHVPIEDRKIATRTEKFATYCSVLEREVEQRVKLEKELTDAQNEHSEFLSIAVAAVANLAKKAFNLDYDDEDEDDNSSIHMTAPLASPVAHGNRPSQCNNRAKSDRSECSRDKNQITPTTGDNPENTKQKLNILAMDRGVVNVSTQVLQTPNMGLTNSAFPKRRIEGNDSDLEAGYHGLGGHGGMATRSATKKMRSSK